jgi:hypothetical protein
MKKEINNTFLYISWAPSNPIRGYFKSYMAVVKAMIHEEISVGLENIGENGIVFLSPLSFKEVKQKLKHNKFPYLLIDISLNIQTDTLDGYLTVTEIEKLKSFLVISKETKLTSLQMRLENALDEEDYISAIVYRDQMNELEGK